MAAYLITVVFRVSPYGMWLQLFINPMAIPSLEEPASLTRVVYSLTGKIPYRPISWSFVAARVIVIMIVSRWNLTCISTALLPVKI